MGVFGEIDAFYHSVIDYIEEYTNFKQYVGMAEESKAKFKERMTIMICKEFAPRRNYDIPKSEIREFASSIIDEFAKQEESYHKLSSAKEQD